MRVPDDLLNCTCFICGKKPDGTFAVGGTAFFVSVPTRDDSVSYTYIVTAKHNIDEAGKKYEGIYIRVNGKDGSYLMIQIAGQWTSPEAENPEQSPPDIAVIISPPLDFDVATVGLPGFDQPGHFLSDAVISEYGVGVGDDLVVVGLFTKQFGRKRNVPIVRMGHIAAMPGEPLRDRDGYDYIAYLAELRSIGGLSGSPVFVLIPTGGYYMGRRSGSEYNIYLLGMIRGHWDFDFGTSEHDWEDDKVGKLNTGIAVVTPAQQIADLLNRDDLVAERNTMLKEHHKRESATNDSGFSTTATSDKPESFRNHENFTRALMSVPKSDQDTE